jgi:hypothetical protein
MRSGIGPRKSGPAGMMRPRMRPPGPFLKGLAVPALVVSMLLAACTKSDGPPPPPPSSSGASTTSSVASPAVPPGDYTYSNAGVIADVKYSPGKSTLTVTNHTGAEIPAPGLYMLDARDGHRIAGTVQNSTPIASGTSKDFTVTFAQQLDQINVGLLILLVGHANYGAFVPPTSK